MWEEGSPVFVTVPRINVLSMVMVLWMVMVEVGASAVARRMLVKKTNKKARRAWNCIVKDWWVVCLKRLSRQSMW